MVNLKHSISVISHDWRLHWHTHMDEPCFPGSGRVSMEHMLLCFHKHYRRSVRKHSIGPQEPEHRVSSIGSSPPFCRGHTAVQEASTVSGPRDGGRDEMLIQASQLPLSHRLTLPLETKTNNNSQYITNNLEWVPKKRERANKQLSKRMEEMGPKGQDGPL